MSKINETVEDKIQSAVLTAIESSNILEIELENRSTNGSFGQDAISVMASSVRVVITL